MESALVRLSSQTTTLETGNKISVNSNSAGQVKPLPSDCCFKGNGLFAIVPTELLTDDNYADFLPTERHLKRKKVVGTARIDDSTTFVGEGGENHPLYALLMRAKENDKQRLEMERTEDSLWIVATSSRKILFANVFNVTCDEDELYFILAVCDHVGFNTAETDIHTTGTVSEIVRRYFSILG